MDNRSIKNIIATQLSQPSWGVEAVAIASAAKAQKRAEKGAPLTCFVLDRGKDEQSDELLQFLTALTKNIHKLEDKTRFQLAIQQGEHWTMCDVIIENKSPIIFVLDASHIIEAIQPICDSFEKYFPKTKIYVYHPDDIENKNVNIR